MYISTMVLRNVAILLLLGVLAISGEVDENSQTTVTRKERFLLATMKFRNHICNVVPHTGSNFDMNGRVTNEGVCKSWKECWVGRGRNVGACTFGHGVCCEYVYTCGNSTSERVSYFVNPETFTDYCSLQVNVYDRRVKQLRLDFEQFSLAQPTKPSAVDNDEAYFCRNDSFTVQSSSVTSNRLGFEALCGENTGQHIYIPVNATLSPASVNLLFSLAERGFNLTGYPRWRIKITQIDCCAPDTKYLCAPPGCLQYYPERSGVFESFNYNNGLGHYQGRLNYAICFKRYNNICSIQYNAQTFNLSANDFIDPYGYNCNWANTNGVINSHDYLFIPDAYLGNGVNASRYCGDSLTNNPATTNAPGPMFVFFRTDQYATISTGEEIGFRIRYQESGSGCYATQRRRRRYALLNGKI